MLRILFLASLKISVRITRTRTEHMNLNRFCNENSDLKKSKIGTKNVPNVSLAAQETAS